MNLIRPNEGLHVRNLRAGYKLPGRLLARQRKVVVDGLDFEVKSGEILGFFGANGSGKSTILKALVDLQSRFDGDVFCNGERLVPGKIAYVPQSPAATLSPWLDVRREIALPLRIQGMPREQWTTAVNELMGETGIWIPLDRKVGSLSGGQRVKVALLRALAVRNPVTPGDCPFVLDEPFEGLDIETRWTLIKLIRAEAAKGVPVIVTSHRLEDLQALGARTLRIDGAPVRRFVEAPLSLSAISGSQPQQNQVQSDALTSVPATREQESMKQRASAYTFGAVGLVGGFALWAILSAFINNPGLFPGPFSVVRAMVDLLSSADSARHFLATMLRATAGWTAANLLAIPIGILLGYDRRFFQAVAPWLSVGRALPIFVLCAPAAGLFPRLPEMQRGFLIWLTLFVISLQGVSAATALAVRRRMDIAGVFGASHIFKLTRIMPFEAISGIFSALEITLPLSIIVTLVIETFLIPETGLGLYVFNHLNDADLSLLFAHILWPGILVAISLFLIRWKSRSFRSEL